MIYFIGNGTGKVKIGYSMDPEQRLKDLQTASPDQLELLAILPGDKITEKEYHEKYKRFKIMGEWFNLENEINYEILAIRSVYGLSIRGNKFIYDEKFIAWERETSTVDQKYDILISEIEKAIDKLENKIDNLNDERDFELEKIDRKYDGNGYEVAK